jgi:KaiC/GvpD/RAD55 family RecA-like ATPase
MSKSKPTQRATAPTFLAKTPTGIRGLDEITDGGLPKSRPTLVCGAAGCGKTLLAMEFIVRGARQFNEPGVFMAFEETGKELADNVASLGFGPQGLIAVVATDLTERKRAKEALHQAHDTLEQRVRERTEELQQANEELTRFNEVMVGRELRMIELKQEVNELHARLGQPPRYEVELDEQARPTP